MARCEMYLVLTSEEVHATIPYALVCMTRFGAQAPVAGGVHRARAGGGHKAVQPGPPLDRGLRGAG